jgi:DNA-binding NarL/FixJ family response regulator
MAINPKKNSEITMSKISVLIVEDHTVLREGLSMMLGLESDIEVVGAAQDGRKAIALATELMPDVILMDVAMPGLNGLEAARQLLHALPTLRIIILTAHSDDVYVNRAVDCGAKGFLLKQDSTRDVYKAIREVHRGGIFYSSSIAKRFTRMNPKSQDRSGKMQMKRNLLTSREMEVLQLVAEGKANKETAAELRISIKTVEKHRGNLMDKLDIHDTAGLTRYAIASGIIESSVQITMI